MHVLFSQSKGFARTFFATLGHTSKNIMKAIGPQKYAILLKTAENQNSIVTPQESLFGYQILGEEYFESAISVHSNHLNMCNQETLNELNIFLSMFNYYHVLAFLIQSYKYVHCAMIFSRRNLCGVSIMHCRKNDKILRSRKTCKNRRLYFEGAYKIIRLQLGVYILPFCIFNILS